MKKKRAGLVIILAFFALYSNAQIDSVALHYANMMSKSDIERRLHVLAADSLEGRESTREGQRKAANYIISEFKAAGLSPGNGNSYLQYFDVVESRFHEASFTQGSTVLQSVNNELFNYNAELDFSSGPSDMVFVGFGIENGSYSDYEGLDVKDKIVVILAGDPSTRIDGFEWEKAEMNNAYRLANYKLALAQEKEVKAIIWLRKDYQEYYDRVDHYLNDRSMALYDSTSAVVQEESIIIYMPDSRLSELFSSNDKAIDKYFVKKMAGKKVKAIQAKEPVQVDIKTIKSYSKSSNVLAKIEGDSTDEWMVITAHYDHVGMRYGDVYNGADDNGSGTSSVIELARLFQAAHKDSLIADKNILFMLVSGEEKGLLGSKYYSEHPVYPLENTIVNLNTDMIGRWDKKHEGGEDYVYVIGADRISQKLHDINEEANQLYVNLDLDYTYNAEDDPNKYYYRSDHYNFAKNGVPVIFYYNGTHADYHKKTDTIEKIDFDILTKRSLLVFYTAWKIAYMKEGLL